MNEQSLAKAVQAIEAGPGGPQVGAFVDLDGTLVAGFTAKAFYLDRVRKREVGVPELARTTSMVIDGKLGGDMGRLGDIGVRGLRGRSLDDLTAVGEALFTQRLGATIRPEARQLVDAHRKQGHSVVIASSATHMQADPIARDLGIEHVLCSELETVDGVLTGEFSGGMLWGESKARAARAFAAARGIGLAGSYAYGNGVEDAPFLANVGHPTAVNPHPGLARIADMQGWPVLVLEDPARTTLRTAAGTAAAVVGMNVGLLAGFGIGLVRHNRRLGADLGLSFGLQSYLALAGVSLEVTGRHNTSARRPCVFVMNHQSALDAMIVGALSQGALSGLGKQEARYLPPAFLLGKALNAVWIDREDPAAGRAGQARLVERLSDGYSLMIAPEGTRQPTPSLGPFRTGAFHVAHQAGVPIVPVVLRNTADLMPGSAKTSRPGRVQVAVLDPVPTDEWDTSSMRRHAADVRAMFVRTLADWPGSA